MRNPRIHNQTPLKISSLHSEQGYEADDEGKNETESGTENETESENETKTDEDEIETIFSAIFHNDQELLKDLVRDNLEGLEQENEDGLKPVFFAIVPTLTSSSPSRFSGLQT